MANFVNMQEGEKIVYSDGHFSGEYNQTLYLKRAVDDGSNRPKFIISASSIINGTYVQQGYIYFYVDLITKSSNFIGINIENEYRNLNIASFLVACWIDFCKNNGFDFLGVNPKQRKPFLLYLLKKYGFEVLDKSLYNTRKDIITICRSADFNDKRKLLLFKDPKHEQIFIGTNVYKHDNYEIIHNQSDVILLDSIILPLQNMKINPVCYTLLDKTLAEAKTEEVIARHTR